MAIAGARLTRFWSWTTNIGFWCRGRGWSTLGSAPGGWAQVAVRRVNALGDRPGKAEGRVLGVDLQEVEPVPGAELHVLDFLEEGADDKIKAWLGGKADVVMSDMAAASSGHKQTDHLRIIALCEAAAELAFDVLEESVAPSWRRCWPAGPRPGCRPR